MIASLLSGAQKGRQIQRSRALEVQPLTGGSYGGGYAGSSRMYGYSQEGIDYNKEAGLRWDNSAVYAILSFFVTCLNGTPLIVAKLDASGKPVPVPNHPLVALLNKPNPWYDGSLLTAGCVFSEASRGNSYVYKHRNPNTSEVIALEYLPEGACFPYTWPGSGEWISEYRIATATGYFRVPPCDILQMRWMTVNPFWPVLGLSPLESCLPDVVADKLASRHEAMIIKNSGVSSVSIAPAKARDGEIQPLFRTEQRDQLRDQIEDNIGGDNKGRPMVWTDPVDVKQIGFDPKALLLTDVRYMSETRICAAFSVQPAVIALAVGLEKSNNRASIEGAIDITIEMGVLPYMRHRARQMTEDLIGEECLGNPGEVIVYDESKISLLKQKLMKMLTDLAGGPIISINEARADAGLGPRKDGDTIRQSAAKEAPPEKPVEKPKPKDPTERTVDNPDGEILGEAGDKVGNEDGIGDNGDGDGG